MKNKFNIKLCVTKSAIREYVPLSYIHKYLYFDDSCFDITRNIGGFNYFGFRLVKTIYNIK
jgi:hypothetical protein